MIEDILSMPEIVEIDGKEYKAQFDCKSYALLESITGKSVYRIQDLIAENNLFLMDSIEVICASLVKNHTEAEIKEVREKLIQSPSLISLVNMPVITSFFKGIAPPEIFKRVLELQGKIKEADKKKREEKSLIEELYNSSVIYNQIDEDVFWKSTPRKILHRFWLLEYDKIKEKAPKKGDEAIKMLKGLMT